MACSREPCMACKGLGGDHQLKGWQWQVWGRIWYLLGGTSTRGQGTGVGSGPGVSTGVGSGTGVAPGPEVRVPG